VRFPRDRIYRPPPLGFLRKTAIALLLIAMVVSAWLFAQSNNAKQPVPVAGQKLFVTDGDSFAVGSIRLRLEGIDAPEIRQLCRDAKGADWPCGRTARALLETLLTQPGLTCEAETHDRYARSLATCRTGSQTDIAAAMVAQGMALSSEFHGMRSYGDEEDGAKRAKRGLWQGNFDHPADYRSAHAALRTNTVPAE
jgi:endonuclease YncB( thermonuclease family)